MARLLKPLATVALGWLLTSALAEVAFRATGDRPSLDLERLYTAFANGNYKLAPNVDTAASLPTGLLTVHTDPLGLRCDEARTFALAPGESVDVLLLGDSQGFGNGATFADSLAGATALAASTQGARVANASVGGHSAASQLQLAEWLHREGHIKPAHYVLLVTPAIAQSGDYLNRANVGADGRLYGHMPNASALLRVWARTHLVSYGRVRDALRHSGLDFEPAKDVPFVFNFYRTGEAEEKLQASFARYVRQLTQFAATHRARVHLVYVPLTLELEFEPIRASAAAHGLSIDRDVPRRVCAAVARACDVSFLDLRPVLEALHARGDLLHLPGDFHYNPELSRNCGTRLWESLQPAISKTTPLASHP